VGISGNSNGGNSGSGSIGVTGVTGLGATISTTPPSIGATGPTGVVGVVGAVGVLGNTLLSNVIPALLALSNKAASLSFRLGVNVPKLTAVPNTLAMVVPNVDKMLSNADILVTN
jgi:hypothetical protein